MILVTLTLFRMNKAEIFFKFQIKSSVFPKSAYNFVIWIPSHKSPRKVFSSSMIELQGKATPTTVQIP